MWAPRARWLVVAFAVTIFIGVAALQTPAGSASALLIFFGAALPPAAALAITIRRLRSTVGWASVSAAILIGSLISTNAALTLELLLPGLVALLVLPVRDAAADLVRADTLEELFYSRGLVILLIHFAIVAPLAEELTKPLALLFLRKRVASRQGAFLVGMAGGVGFAIVENLLYEGVSAGSWWAAVTLLRGIGGVLHPLTAGLVALGVYGVMQREPGAPSRLLIYYGVAVGLHAAWNGGQVILASAFGVYWFGTEQWELDLFGVALPGVMVAFLILMSIALWWLLFVITGRLSAGERPAQAPVPLIRLDQPRSLAFAATGLLGATLAIGAQWGPLIIRQLELVLGA